jgi:hypothetical protein
MIAAFAKHQATALYFPPPLSELSVEKADSIAEQWIIACNLETEEGWKSVLSFDDSDETRSLWKYRALQQLALLYMKKGEMEKVFNVFLTFAEFPDYSPQARSFGYAGLFWYHVKQGNTNMANEALADYLTISYKFHVDEPTYQVFSEATSLREEQE